MNKLLDRNKYINNMLVIGILFQAYKLFDIGGFELGLPMIFVLIANLIFVIKLIKPQSNRINIISILFIIYIILNYLINYKYSQLTSMLLSIFFIGSTIFTYRIINEDKFNKCIDVYIIIVTLLSIYGIYQFIGRSQGLPFTNLYFNGYMISGFNWTNPIWISGNEFIRINAIYREPSFYSQFTALGIVFIISGAINNKINSKKIVALVINFIGMILSFSGTGFIILIIYALYAFLFEVKGIDKKTKIIICFFISSVVTIIVFIIFNLDNDLLIYFINRFNEISNNTGSGGVRFKASFEILFEALKTNPLIGHGIGSREQFLYNHAYFINGPASIDSTIPRIGVELGLIGISMWILFMTIFINANVKNIYYRSIVLFLFVQMFNGDYFLQITNWIFIYFINCKIKFNDI